MTTGRLRSGWEHLRGSWRRARWGRRILGILPNVWRSLRSPLSNGGRRILDTLPNVWRSLRSPLSKGSRRLLTIPVDLWPKLQGRLSPEPKVSVLLVDTQAGQWQEPQPVYWRALVPRREIQEDNPRAWGAYKEHHEESIRWTRYGGPVGTGLAVGTACFLLLMPNAPPGATVGLLFISSLLGLFVGAVIGIPLSALVIRRWLKTDIIYVAGRVSRALAEELGLAVRPGADWAVVWAVPPPVVAPSGAGDASSSLVEESELAIWTYEQLSRGENGRASDLLIRALQAQHGGGDQKSRQTRGEIMGRLDGVGTKMRGG